MQALDQIGIFTQGLGQPSQQGRALLQCREYRVIYRARRKGKRYLKLPSGYIQKGQVQAHGPLDKVLNQALVKHRTSGANK